MRTFAFLRRHKANVLIALVLLMLQAYSELTLPSIMSGIVDIGISRGGIQSVVPDKVTEVDLSDVELFLSPDELELVEGSYSKPDSKGVRTFDGTEDDRGEIEGFLGEAEMVVYQLREGGVKGGLSTLASHMGSESTVISPADVRAKVVAKLGDEGEAMIASQAIGFVKLAYANAGVDVGALQTDYLIREGATMLGYAFAAALCAIAAAYNSSRTAAKVARDLRHDVYERVLSFSPAEMGEFSEASLITRATNDIQQIQMVLVMCLRMVLFAPCMGVGAVAKVIGFGSTGLQWIIVAGLVAISVVIGALMALTMPKFRRMQDLVDRNNLVAREIVTGVMPIRAFGRSKSEEARYDEANRELTATYIFTNRAMSFMMPIMMMIMNLISVAIVWFGGQGVDAGTMQVGDLMAYMNYTMQVIMSFMIITMVAVMLAPRGYRLGARAGGPEYEVKHQGPRQDPGRGPASYDRRRLRSSLDGRSLVRRRLLHVSRRLVAHHRARLVHGAAGADARHHRLDRSGQVDARAAHSTSVRCYLRIGDGRRRGCEAHGAGGAPRADRLRAPEGRALLR